MIYIKTPKELYKKYVSEHGTDRVNRGVKLYANHLPNSILTKLQLTEIKFQPIFTDYKTLIKNIEGNELRIYVFSCKSGNKYRLDLLEIDSENYWTGDKHYNISFLLIENNDENYNEPTNFNELYEVFKKIMFILNDINLNIIYVVGNTFDVKKNLLYKDFIDSFENREIKIGNSKEFGETYYIKKI